MTEETVDITIDTDGRVLVEVHGVAGTGCLETTEALLALLGGDVRAQDLTAEAYADQAVGEAAGVRQGMGRT